MIRYRLEYFGRRGLRFLGSTFPDRQIAIDVMRRYNQIAASIHAPRMYILRKVYG